MTFLLQKFNAINRTRTEVRGRNGLRSSASGIAFTGRFAACLLLAGFLGVGSAMAQPHVLREGGGAVRVKHASAQEVHHYLIDTDGDGMFDDETSVANPTGQGGTVTNTFLIGNIALVTVYGDDSLDVSPVAKTGAFKIALAADAEEDIDADSNPGTPVNFEIVSANAPMLKGIAGAAGAYNMGADADMVSLDLMPRDATSKQYTLTDWFSDPNDVFLTYEAKADMVAKTVADPAPDEVPLRPQVEKDGIAIVSATISGNKLTISLTDKAMNLDQTDIWVFARDGSEYARKRVQLTVGSATNPYVMTPLADKILRENAATDTEIDLAAGFMDPDVASADRTGAACELTDSDTTDFTGPEEANNNDQCYAKALTYAVAIDDKSATKVGAADAFTWVSVSMTAKVEIGSGSATLAVRPRSAGSATFTVTATDKGQLCKDGYDYVPSVLNNPSTTTNEAAAAKCMDSDANSDPELKDTAPYPNTKSVKDAFTVTVVTKTTPEVGKAIPALSGKTALMADGAAKTVNLADVDAKTTGAQAAFMDPTKAGLTYTVSTSKKDSSVVVATVDSTVVTLEPQWGKGGTATVMVKATNTLDESAMSEFKVTVNSATEPIVNPMVVPLLALGYSLNTGDKPLVVNLRNLTGAEEMKDYVPLFIDPDADPKDLLPGGLLYKMQVSDVKADHVYTDQSMENDVYTSAMRITLDPVVATLTVRPTAANSATVTVWGIDRQRNMISATTTITVVSGVGTEGEELPTEVELSQNYPNPFNPQTTIDYALPQAGDVSLVVYDMLGREVDVLLDGPQAAGRHTVRFGANHLPNGTYVYRLVAADKTITRTMVLVK